LLPSGYRAIAINIDTTGSSTAGGFILPNDRVDVLRVMRDENARTNEYISETILTNVRVLAIGQSLNDKNAQGSAASTAVGTNTATLELSPRQVEQIISAQRMGGGTLTLALRSALDLNRKDDDREDDNNVGLQVVRFGQSASR
jgi:pilus assembly protein CpaB